MISPTARSFDLDPQDVAKEIVSAVATRMFGLGEVVRLCLAAYFTGGHVLLEGNPGTGKTELVKNLSTVLALRKWGRIQFTPDLMPSDITGTERPSREDRNRWEFFKGPIFCNLLLADEINRATPKTQSAMLEAMAEGHVTVLGETRVLPTPFMVLATQNPIEHEGTYALPEAQADRFMFKLTMPPSKRAVLDQILDKEASGETLAAQGAQPTLLGEFPADVTQRSIRSRIFDVHAEKPVRAHIINMVLASNQRARECEGIPPQRMDRLARLCRVLFDFYGLGPRAAIAMMRGAKALALLFAKDRDEIGAQELGTVVVPALRHRLKLGVDWNERVASLDFPFNGDPLTPEHAIASFCLLSAPDGRSYESVLKDRLRVALAPVAT